MPVLNEESYLEAAVNTILSQNYSGAQEIVLALGPSSDNTRGVAERLHQQDTRIRLIDNPQRDIPIGLNLAIASSTHDIIIRVDAHSELSDGYTQLGVEILRETGAVNLGGVMHALGTSPTQQAIAAAYNSPFGLGGGTYHGEGAAGAAESAYLGIFRREAFDTVGGYDETLRRGEDWELNLRLRQAGGLVWFDPRLQVTYWPRTKLSDLARQFFATGAWRSVLVRRYPRAHPWRFFAPGSLVVLLCLGVGVALLRAFQFHAAPWLDALMLVPVLYAGGLVIAALSLQGVRGFRARALGCATLATMHITWGAGFVYGLVMGAKSIVDRSRISLNK